jgi:NAD+ diphosphatase
MPFVAGLRPLVASSTSVAWFVFRDDQLLVRLNGERTLLPSAEDVVSWAPTAEAHYLGRLDDVDCYAIALTDGVEPPPEFGFEGLRALFGRLREDHFGIAGRAVQIVEWDRSHRFCGRCGEPTERMETERARRCPRCGFMSFPRLSPAVIMRIDRGDRILLARNVSFAQGFFSVLAGFVEPGESLEEAVVREVHEEVGLDLTDIRYFGSQPWPFPHQLMIGFTAQYAAGEIRIEPTELAEAGWYTRDALPALPGKISISRRLIDAWLEGG